MLNRYSNKFLVRVDDVMTRIAFFDEVNTQEGPRLDAADTVVMLNNDAKQLAEIIQKTQAQHEATKGTKQ